jgi:hypothetical protein
MSMHVSGGGVNPPASSKGLVVATDALTIYEAGSQYQVSIDEVANNPVALKMLFNELNQVKRELAAAKQGGIPSAISVVLAVVNALGVVLVAFGSVYLSMKPAPEGAGWILGIGGLLTLITTVTPAVLALTRSRKQKHEAETKGISSGRIGLGGGDSFGDYFERRLRAVVEARRNVTGANEGDAARP